MIVVYSRFELNGKLGRPFDVVKLDLALITGEHADVWVPGTVTFLGCAAVYVEIDVWAKHHCSDMIADTTCLHDPDGIAILNIADARAPTDPLLEEMLTFELKLVPPSGLIRVVARDFDLVGLPT